jgi:hypothetical protein
MAKGLSFTLPKPKQLMLPAAQRAAIAGNARVHAKIIRALKLTPLDMMLANMNLAWREVNEMEAYIASNPDAAPAARLESFKHLLRLRDRVQAYAVKAAPYVHPKLHAVAPTVQEQTARVEVDPLREHLEEMAKVFRLKCSSGKPA